MARSGSAVAATRVVDKQERQINLVLVLLNTDLARCRSRGCARTCRATTAGPTRCDRSSSATSASCARRASRSARSRSRATTRSATASTHRRSGCPDLGLDEDEARALGLAAATLGFGGDGVSRVLLDVPPAMPAGTLTSLPALPYLYRAIAGRCAVAFVHKGKERRVAPGTLTRHARPLVPGAVDLDIDELRHFRVDRISGRPARRGPRHRGGRRRSGSPSSAPRRPWERGRGGRPVTVRVDAAVARSVQAELADGADVEPRDDGSVVVTVGWGLPGLARNWVLSMLHHAEVLSPSRVRDEVVEWLERIRDAPRHDARRGDVATAPASSSHAAPSAGAAAARGADDARPAADDVAHRARRMRFGLTRDAMRTVLLEAACMGVPPFLHGDLLDIQVPIDDEEGDDVRWIDSGLFRPQLTWRDGFELAASAARRRSHSPAPTTVARSPGRCRSSRR